MRALVSVLCLVLAVVLWFVLVEPERVPRDVAPTGSAGEAAPGKGAGDLAAAPATGDVARSRERAQAGAGTRGPIAAAGGRAAPLLELRVLAEGSELPLAGFRVHVSTYGVAELEVERVTDADGRFELELPFARGMVYLEHVVAPGHARFAEPWELVPDSWLVDAADGAAAGAEGKRFARVVHARPPLVRVRTRVVRANGAPADGAAVRLSAGLPIESGWISWRRSRVAIADARGEVRFLVHDPEEAALMHVLELRDAVEGEVADALRIGPPLDEGPHELRLYPGGQVAFETVDAEDAPVPGVQVTLLPDDRARHRGPLPGLGDEFGRGRIVDVPAGGYVAFANEPTTRSVLGPRAELALGPSERAELRLVVAHEEIALLVSGSVVDEAGAPVADKFLAVSVDGRGPETIRTDADGAFRFEGGAKAERVTVYGVAGLFDPPVEPEVVTVPAGTEDLLFTVAPEPPALLALFEVVDARTNELPPAGVNVGVRVYREPPAGGRVTGTLLFVAEGGTCEVEFAPAGETRWLVSVLGYRERRGVFDPSAFEAGPPLIHVALEPGFRREITVCDQRTGAVLAGVAAMTDEGERLATTAFDGTAVLEASVWPEWLTFELGGYEPLRWRAQSNWFHHARTFWMEARD